MSRLQPAAALADLTEKEWDAQLFGNQRGLAAQLGWKLRYHTLRSKGSPSGFPDRVLVRDRLIVAELKVEHGKPSDVQVEWLDGLAAAGVETYLWKPSDLGEIGEILADRWQPFAFYDNSRGPGGRPGLIAHRRDGGVTSIDRQLKPASIWIPGVGRADTLDNEQQTLLTKGATAA